jgi:hypothetical protein
MKTIMGVCGLKRAGKDTLAKLIQQNNPKFRITHFADKLKQFSSEIFDIEYKRFEENDLKEKPFDIPIHMDDFLSDMRSVTGLILFSKNKIAKNPRELLQFFGTEYVREVSANYWIDTTLSSIGPDESVLVGDCRFVNEEKAIKKMNGSVIKVVRFNDGNIEFTTKDMHPSEVEVAHIEADLTILNPTGNIPFLEKIAQCIADDFDKAKRLYDISYITEIRDTFRKNIKKYGQHLFDEIISTYARV